MIKNNKIKLKRLVFIELFNYLIEKKKKKVPKIDTTYEIQIVVI